MGESNVAVLDMVRIRFPDRETAKRGYPIFAFVGTVVYTNEPNTYVIDRNPGIQKLKEANIPFEEVRSRDPDGS